MVMGTFSDGLTIYVLPQAMAYGRNQNVIMPGKLKGAIAAQTPTGCRIMNSSIPEAMSSQIRALHHCRNAAGDFHVFDCPAHLTLSLDKGLAAFHGNRAGDIVKVICRATVSA